MKLLLRRDQRSGMLGKVIFTLTVRADLSDEERGRIKKYKLSDALLYQRLDEGQMPTSTGISGFLAAGAFYARQLEIRARDLDEGTSYECKDIVEMLIVESQIKDAAKTFVSMLAAAAKFGGEEVVEIEA